MSTGLVQARIDDAVKKEAAAVPATIGLTISDAVRLLLMRIAQDKELPFSPLVPNAETIAAMEEAEAGKLRRVKTIGELFKELNEDD
jgi:DNA-damage-inducible protein J